MALALASTVVTAGGATAERVAPQLLGLYDLDVEPSGWKLPQKLDEISGLASTADGRLLAHEDQNAIVYEIDRGEGRLVKAFALGKPTAKGDFEGIAVAKDRVFLVTSGGRLYETREVEDGERSRFNTYDSETDSDCLEVEGLAYVASGEFLALACKTLRGDLADEEVRIHRWSIGERTPLEPIRIAREQFGDAAAEFHPSAIEWDPDSDHFLILSSRAHAIAEVTLEGEVLGVRELAAKHHRQAEGLTFGRDTNLLIADEGAGKRPRLSVYPRVPGTAAVVPKP